MNNRIDHLEGERKSVNLQMLNNPKMHILEYKGGIIKGYSGMMELSGPPELLQIAIGARSSNDTMMLFQDYIGLRN